jgi:hypothetical protein
VTTTVHFRNMSALPPVEWGEKERATGAVSYSQHVLELHKHLTTTTTSAPLVTSTTHSTAEKISHVVATVVPQLIESIHKEFVEPTTHSIPTNPTSVVPVDSTTSMVPVSTTASSFFPTSTPPTVCVPESPYVQVNNFFF